MVLVLLSSQARTALATPTPPTSNAVSPMKDRNRVTRPISRVSRGEDSSRVRIRQPASGKAVLISAMNSGGAVASGRRSR